ncbi:hypothetical protein EKL30_13760 [Candidimonas sp. SYP-B2681]|uniref:hypothetical protein n=1 Tax=Candidimonas sp. SYP-B2681 TaxID=2497686 RepID=UPI000F892D40|nr:hypothetical protein [Candidimonas sp. SYP-B2681]RTZ41625.1 hypothetical protein EKL30_13760 [Candidimonas sp. SYP-B2681]
MPHKSVCCHEFQRLEVMGIVATYERDCHGDFSPAVWATVAVSTSVFISTLRMDLGHTDATSDFPAQSFTPVTMTVMPGAWGWGWSGEVCVRRAQVPDRGTRPRCLSETLTGSQWLPVSRVRGRPDWGLCPGSPGHGTAKH